MFDPFTACLQSLRVLAEVVRQSKTVNGRVRLYKILYLLKQVHLAELSEVPFVFDDHGPLSLSIADALMDGVDEGVLVEHRKGSDKADGERHLPYTYVPGANVAVYADDLSGQSRAAVRNIIAHTAHQHWRTLELATGAHYLEAVEGLTRTRAVQRMTASRSWAAPPCRAHHRAALDLLRALQL